jgi:hypothetical protein
MTDEVYLNEYPTGPDPITKFKADLRAKVEALPNEWNDFVRRADVLALIDGSSDGPAA